MPRAGPPLVLLVLFSEHCSQDRHVGSTDGNGGVSRSICLRRHMFLVLHSMTVGKEPLPSLRSNIPLRFNTHDNKNNNNDSAKNRGCGAGA